MEHRNHQPYRIYSKGKDPEADCTACFEDLRQQMQARDAAYLHCKTHECRDDRRPVGTLCSNFTRDFEADSLFAEQLPTGFRSAGISSGRKSELATRIAKNKNFIAFKRKPLRCGGAVSSHPLERSSSTVLSSENDGNEACFDDALGACDVASFKDNLCTAGRKLTKLRNISGAGSSLTAALNGVLDATLPHYRSDAEPSARASQRAQKQKHRRTSPAICASKMGNTDLSAENDRKEENTSRAHNNNASASGRCYHGIRCSDSLFPAIDRRAQLISASADNPLERKNVKKRTVSVKKQQMREHSVESLKLPTIPLEKSNRERGKGRVSVPTTQDAHSDVKGPHRKSRLAASLAPLYDAGVTSFSFPDPNGQQRSQCREKCTAGTHHSEDFSRNSKYRDSPRSNAMHSPESNTSHGHSHSGDASHHRPVSPTSTPSSTEQNVEHERRLHCLRGEQQAVRSAEGELLPDSSAFSSSLSSSDVSICSSMINSTSGEDCASGGVVVATRKPKQRTPLGRHPQPSGSDQQLSTASSLPSSSEDVLSSSATSNDYGTTPEEEVEDLMSPSSTPSASFLPLSMSSSDMEARMPRRGDGLRRRRQDAHSSPPLASVRDEKVVNQSSAKPGERKRKRRSHGETKRAALSRDSEPSSRASPGEFEPSCSDDAGDRSSVCRDDATPSTPNFSKASFGPRFCKAVQPGLQMATKSPLIEGVLSRTSQRAEAVPSRSPWKLAPLGEKELPQRSKSRGSPPFHAQRTVSEDADENDEASGEEEYSTCPSSKEMPLPPPLPVSRFSHPTSASVVSSGPSSASLQGEGSNSRASRLRVRRAREASHPGSISPVLPYDLDSITDHVLRVIQDRLSVDVNSFSYSAHRRRDNEAVTGDRLESEERERGIARQVAQAKEHADAEARAQLEAEERVTWYRALCEVQQEIRLAKAEPMPFDTLSDSMRAILEHVIRLSDSVNSGSACFIAGGSLCHAEEGATHPSTLKDTMDSAATVVFMEQERNTAALGSIDPKGASPLSNTQAADRKAAEAASLGFALDSAGLKRLTAELRGCRARHEVEALRLRAKEEADRRAREKQVAEELAQALEVERRAREKQVAEELAQALEVERRAREKQVAEELAQALEVERRAREKQVAEELAQALEVERRAREKQEAEELAQALEVERRAREKQEAEELAQALEVARREEQQRTKHALEVNKLRAEEEHRVATIFDEEVEAWSTMLLAAAFSLEDVRNRIEAAYRDSRSSLSAEELSQRTDIIDEEEAETSDLFALARALQEAAIESALMIQEEEEREMREEDEKQRLAREAVATAAYLEVQNAEAESYEVEEQHRNAEELATKLRKKRGSNGAGSRAIRSKRNPTDIKRIVPSSLIPGQMLGISGSYSVEAGGKIRLVGDPHIEAVEARARERREADRLNRKRMMSMLPIIPGDPSSNGGRTRFSTLGNRRSSPPLPAVNLGVVGNAIKASKGLRGVSPPHSRLPSVLRYPITDSEDDGQSVVSKNRLRSRSSFVEDGELVLEVTGQRVGTLSKCSRPSSISSARGVRMMGGDFSSAAVNRPFMGTPGSAVSSQVSHGDF